MKQLYYVVQRGDSREYGHLEIKVGYKTDLFDPPYIVFTWQANKLSPDRLEHVDQSAWYAGHAAVKFDHQLDMPAAIALARTVCNKSSEGWGIQVEDVLARLKMLKSIRVVVDRRVGWLPVDQVPDADLSRWGDAIDRSIVTDCLAHDAEEAKRLIAIALFTEAEDAQYESRKKHLRDALERFEAAGRPVRLLDSVDGQVTSLQELLAI